MTITLDHLLTRPATMLLRARTGEDEAGDPTYDVVERAVVCELQQTSSGEEHEGGSLVTRFRVWLPADVELDGWDAIVVDGDTYEVDGDPSRVWNPLTQTVHHVEGEVVRAR
jgi:hypothetical protein